jgi:hypothetical protein
MYKYILIQQTPSSFMTYHRGCNRLTTQVSLVEQELFTLPELELRNPIFNAVCELLLLNTNPSFFSAISWREQVRPTRLVGFCIVLVH